MGRKADISKAKRELGYYPSSIAGAVREAYQWFQARGTIDGPRGRERGGSTLSVFADTHVE